MRQRLLAAKRSLHGSVRWRVVCRAGSRDGKVFDDQRGAAGVWTGDEAKLSSTGVSVVKAKCNPVSVQTTFSVYDAAPGWHGNGQEGSRQVVTPTLASCGERTLECA